MNIKDLLETLHKHNDVLLSNEGMIGSNNLQLVYCTV